MASVVDGRRCVAGELKLTGQRLLTTRMGTSRPFCPKQSNITQ